MSANPFFERELRVPQLEPADASAVARDAFGVDGVAEELGSHQDQNFRIDAPHARYVLKVANPMFSQAELEMQNRGMEHVAALLDGAVPLPVRSRRGQDLVEIERGGARYQLRLVTYLEGEPLRSWSYLAPQVLYKTGRLAGRVAAALASFEHPAIDRVLQWDVQHAADVVTAFVGYVRDPKSRARLEQEFEQAARILVDLAPELRRQVIHGDITGWNVVAEPDQAARPRPRGLIDFGDMTRSWLAAECAVLAVAVAEHDPTRMLESAVEIVRGFHATYPLLEREIAALPALMTARAAVSVVSCAQQAAIEPDDTYIAASLSYSWSALDAVVAMPSSLAHVAFREACGFPAAAPQTGCFPRAAGPIVEGMEQWRPVPVDLSPRTDVLGFGAWRDPAAVSAAIRRAGAGSDEQIPIGRYGECRLVHDEGPAHNDPRTMHLGCDLFLPEGTTVLAPFSGRVVHANTRDLILSIGEDFRFRLAGITPAINRGDVVGQGDFLGWVAEPPQDARLPAHLHVQLACAPLDEMPDSAPATLAAAWRALCPDPGPLIGLEREMPGESKQDVLARRRCFVANAHPLYTSVPPQVERGWRQWLYDVHGRAYLDVINNIAIVGHSHPRVEAAAAKQLRLLNTNSRFLYDAMGRFAERLIGLVPNPLEVVFLVNSGSEANDLALRLAREVTGQHDVVCLEDSYHGWTRATDELLNPRSRSDGLAETHPIVRPSPYTGVYRDDPRGTDLYLRDARSTLERLTAEHRPPAAFISEPFLGNSGGVPLPDDYLAQVYSSVRAAGGLCIADEVQVGYGRLGHYFWAFEQQKVVPDIVTIAKATGNGHPVAAVITTRAIADVFGKKTDLFASVGGSPVSCEVALAVLDIIEEERLQENAREVGDYLDHRLRPIVEQYPIVGAQHGIGLYRGLELVRDGDPNRPAPEEALAICERMCELGVIVQPTGKHDNVLKLKPPLCFTMADADFFADTLQQTLRYGW